MNPIDNILHLIEKGDAALVLAEENITDILNDLMKYELIDLCEGKVLLTAKGKQVRMKGFQAFLDEISNSN